MSNSVSLTSASDVESAWEQWREHLLAQCEDLSKDGQQTQLYLLVDSRANPGIDRLLAQVPRLGWTSLWQDSVLESYTDIAPYLIQLDRIALSDPRDLQNRLVRRLWRESLDLHMLTWIWSPSSLESLSGHLRYHCRYATPEKRAFFLHFYDNRILKRLRAVWTSEQAHRFLSPCVEVWYRDRDLTEVVWRNHVAAAEGSVIGEHVLTIEQHSELLRLGQADKLAMQLRSMYDEMLADIPDLTLYARISEQLERAGQYRITSDDDLLNYASKGIVVSPCFDEHPVIRERLRRAVDGEITHREALSGIDGSVLNEASRMDRPETERARMYK
ncbi:DUF4123 domain-containing protein [Paraburkholderia heleia]|uniref:DUF4123 domain-containing protein n=1 Tax=Paraburkholderia heleia TaxID=634127 RepID=UPI0005A7A950|nr:DUF4123 domain-containing protein [Paraburkholderia heleia]